ncbi:hypothetical protein [Acetonema longum]|uniref:Uncharacterized protein n=1 Tax=Acetonema longum DSM 6540 TaxID=1009370 RepID=F7NH35_9FIRM|nr:hypothetical protein [Acetonema longum]EGO64637.1 hypothetical protein ALO_06893 [Acetonema longum DSM 6540]
MMEKETMRVAKVQGVYFRYPPQLSLNQEPFLMAVLMKARTATNEAYFVVQNGDTFAFIPEETAKTPERWSI